MLLAFVLLLIVVSNGNALSPVVIVPGTGGSQIEAKLVGKPETAAWYCHSETSDYYKLWLEITQLMPWALTCWADNMRLVWNDDNTKASNAPGVLTRVPGFGQTYSVESLDSLGTVKYMRPLVDHLTTLGYVKGHNLKAAPYDFRYSPESIPDNYMFRLGDMIEEMYNQNNQPITLVTHSYGCPVTLQFLSNRTQEWKNKYIKQWIALSGVFGGTIQEVLLYATGYLEGIPDVIINRLTIRREQRSSTSNLYMLPNAQLWRNDDVIATTPSRKYKVSEVDDFLTDIGFPQGVTMRQHISNTSTLIQNAPGVPVHCYYGNIPESTVNHLLFTENFPNYVHSVEKGLGDGTVNHDSLSLCLKFREMQNETVSVKEVNGVTHNGIMEDDNVLEDIKALLLK